MEYRLPFSEYNKALKKGKLMGLKCGDCGGVTCPPMMVCQECASVNHEVFELNGKGKIVTFTVSYIAAKGRENELPYIIVMVELDEGPWIMGNLIEIDPSKADMGLIGRRVSLGHRVFPGDKYSAGDAARPVFSFAE
ncbi:MAG: Zn-ribbon domain-containing OB-fold protein [Firmicutes bacterium]|nr:Zn-ribbon domain-containing OB-fold protein [Bacillota bacterium]